MSKEEFLTGIVTYNPDIARLRENVEAAVLQVGNMVIIDNGSDNLEEIKRLIAKYSQIDVVAFDKNHGIAYALRRLMDMAICENYKWVLSLDQDSIILPGLAEHYMERCEGDSIGALTCELVDRNYDRNWNNSIEDNDVNECFTSGFFLKCDAYLKTSGYNTDLFIDFVDYDICYKLLEQGMEIKRIEFPGVLHEYGKAEYKNFMGRRVIITNHPYWRKYYMVRNDILLSIQHPAYVKKKCVCHRILAMIIKSTLYEGNKLKSLIYISKGIIDGGKAIVNS